VDIGVWTSTGTTLQVIDYFGKCWIAQDQAGGEPLRQATLQE
jgi:hypothetical protein